MQRHSSSAATTIEASSRRNRLPLLVILSAVVTAAVSFGWPALLSAPIFALANGQCDASLGLAGSAPDNCFLCFDPPNATLVSASGADGVGEGATAGEAFEGAAFCSTRYNATRGFTEAPDPSTWEGGEDTSSYWFKAHFCRCECNNFFEGSTCNFCPHMYVQPEAEAVDEEGEAALSGSYCLRCADGFGIIDSAPYLQQQQQQTANGSRGADDDASSSNNNRPHKGCAMLCSPEHCAGKGIPFDGSTDGDRAEEVAACNEAWNAYGIAMEAYLMSGGTGPAPTEPAVCPRNGCDGICECESPYFDPLQNCGACVGGESRDFYSSDCKRCADGYVLAEGEDAEGLPTVEVGGGKGGTSGGDSPFPPIPICYEVCGFFSFENSTTGPNACNPDHTAKVNGTTMKDGCSCECTGYWGGKTCNDCPFESANGECLECADGYLGQAPDCVRNFCDVYKGDCGIGAIYATGLISNGCECTCGGLWTGTSGTCDVCPAGVSVSPGVYHPPYDCQQCLEGYTWANASDRWQGCVPMCVAHGNCTTTTMPTTTTTVDPTTTEPPSTTTVTDVPSSATVVTSTETATFSSAPLRTEKTSTTSTPTFPTSEATTAITANETERVRTSSTTAAPTESGGGGDFTKDGIDAEVGKEEEGPRTVAPIGAPQSNLAKSTARASDGGQAAAAAIAVTVAPVATVGAGALSVANALRRISVCQSEEVRRVYLLDGSEVNASSLGADEDGDGQDDEEDLSPLVFPLAFLFSGVDFGGRSALRYGVAAFTNVFLVPLIAYALITAGLTLRGLFRRVAGPPSPGPLPVWLQLCPPSLLLVPLGTFAEGTAFCIGVALFRNIGDDAEDEGATIALGSLAAVGLLGAVGFYLWALLCRIPRRSLSLTPCGPLSDVSSPSASTGSLACIGATITRAALKQRTPSPNGRLCLPSAPLSWARTCRFRSPPLCRRRTKASTTRSLSTMRPLRHPQRRPRRLPCPMLSPPCMSMRLLLPSPPPSSPSTATPFLPANAFTIAASRR